MEEVRKTDNRGWDVNQGKSGIAGKSIDPQKPNTVWETLVRETKSRIFVMAAVLYAIGVLLQIFTSAPEGFLEVVGGWWFLFAAIVSLPNLLTLTGIGTLFAAGRLNNPRTYISGLKIMIAGEIALAAILISIVCLLFIPNVALAVLIVVGSRGWYIWILSFAIYPISLVKIIKTISALRKTRNSIETQVPCADLPRFVGILSMVSGSVLSVLGGFGIKDMVIGAAMILFDVQRIQHIRNAEDTFDDNEPLSAP